MSAPANRLGIEMLTLLGMPPVEHVRLAGELGCVGISTGLSNLPMERLGQTPFYPDWSLADDPALRREMKAAMADTGVHIALGEGFNTRPGSDVADYANWLDIMVELGARRINAIGMEPDLPRAHDQLAKLADMVIERGMPFTIELVKTNVLESLADGLVVIDHIGRGRCALLIDAMHFFRSGNTLDDLRALDPDLIGYAQLCDVPLVSTSASYMQEAMFERRVPGDGELPLAEFVAALPADIEIGIEVPNLAALQSGSPRDHAARAVAAARVIGA